MGGSGLRETQSHALGGSGRHRDRAARHGAARFLTFAVTPVQQRRRLFDSVVRHVNAGDFDLDEANAFLHTFGIARAAGPGAVSFHLPVARAMIHEDVESDIGTCLRRVGSGAA